MKSECEGAAECVECGRRSGRGKTRDPARTRGALDRPRQIFAAVIFDKGLGDRKVYQKLARESTGQILVKHSLTIDAGGRWARQNFLAFTFHEK